MRLKHLLAAGLMLTSSASFAADIYFEDFEGGSLDGWTPYNLSGSLEWHLDSYAGDSFAYVTGYGDDADSDDWIVSPEIDLSGVTNTTLQFTSQQNYDGTLLVKVSSDFAGDVSTATWVDITAQVALSEGGWVEVESGVVDLSAFDGGSLYVAFHYMTDPVTGGTWEMDDVLVQGDLAVANIYFEDFENAALEGWTPYSLSGSAEWHAADYSGDNFAEVSGYGDDADSDDWLVSPEIDLSGVSNTTLQFYSAQNYDGTMLVKVSSDFAGDVSTAGWTDITSLVTLSSGNWEDVASGVVDLSAFDGSSLFVAFHYMTDPVTGGTWQMDDVLVQGVANLELSADLSISDKDNLYTARETLMAVTAANGAGEPYTISWDFGDGSTGEGASVAHEYVTAGDYTVSVTVEDSGSGTVTETETITVGEATALDIPQPAGDIRVATFNAALNRATEGELITDLAAGDNQAMRIAEIIQRVRPDIVLINEFDYDVDGTALNSFMANYLAVSQNGAATISYPYYFSAESNTGLPSGGFDFNNDGNATDTEDDAFGYGSFPGQYAMVVLSQYPIMEADIRTFQKFLWKDMPDALLPEDPNDADGDGDTTSWYNTAELDVFRLSSKSHWDVPVEIEDGKVLHVLASHPTPPVFDGDEDRNGTRNHDEIRFWADYIDNESYIYDDNGVTGGLMEDSWFVILGDENASPDEGDGIAGAINQLLDHPLVNASLTPMSDGGVENDPDNTFSESHTANWMMRADYVLPSVAGITVEAGEVFWPTFDNQGYYLVNAVGTDYPESSDHRLVYLDLSLEGFGEGGDGSSKDDDDDGFLGSLNLWVLAGLLMLAGIRKIKLR